MSTLDSKDFGLKLYNKFPPKYKEDDVPQSYALKRYLESLADGGFSHIIDDTNGLLTLVNPNTIDAKFLPVLYKQFGLEIFNGIPEGYLRYLLPKLGDAWTQRGSIAIVEFITSSLSGVKVTSEITYDDKENPYIKVFLEMDYNLGDYFPDVEHFIRLMEKFLPFYVDKSIVYIYTFYDEQVLKTFEESLMYIHDDRIEELTLRSEKSNEDVDIDTYKDSIVVLHSIEAEISNQGDDIIDKVKTGVESDLVRLRPIEELLADKTSYTYNEYAGIYMRGQKVEGNAIFAQAIFGESIFNKEDDFSDITEDKITYSVEETGSIIITTSSTNTNDVNGVPNENNAVGGDCDVCIDVIITNEGTTTIIN